MEIRGLGDRPVRKLLFEFLTVDVTRASQSKEKGKERKQKYETVRLAVLE